MRELPILFSTDMVLANLAGTKNQTRRIFKDHPRLGSDLSKVDLKVWMGDHPEYVLSFCPYGKPGDILYVRENWRPRDCEFYPPMLNIEYKAGNYGFPPLATNYSLNFHPGLELVEKIEYSMIAECKKKGLNIENYGRFVYKNFPISWRPSIHLPRELSRIWLQVTDVQVERLQDISEEDAEQEGVCYYPFDGTFHNYFKTKGLRESDGVECLLAKGSFESLWCSINGINSWDLNPWVWVVKYKILSTTGRDNIPKDILLQLDGKEAKL